MTDQRWRTDLIMPASERTRASSQTGHIVLETMSGTATRATTLPDCASATKHVSIASPGPVRYAAPTKSSVGSRRRGSDAEGSQKAAVDVDGEAMTNVAASDVLTPVDDVTAAVVQSTCPTKPAYGQRLIHGSSLTTSEASDTATAFTPEYGAPLYKGTTKRAKGARDVLGVADCVNEGVSD